MIDAVKESQSPPTEQSAALRRDIGVWGLSANIVNIMVGAGIFVLPATVARGLGPHSFIAYIFCGVLIMLIMLCFAEIGSKITDPGGAYTYIERTLGRYAGFLVAILFISSCVSADAAVAHALAGILENMFPLFKTYAVKVAFFAVLFSVLAFVNVIGVKQGIGLVKVVTVLKLVPLVVLAIFGWKDVETSNLTWQGLPSWDSIGATSLILFFAFQGGESGLSVSGEVRNPTRSIPRAIFIGILGVLILYILIQTVSIGVLGDSLSTYGEAPLAEVSGRIFGSAGYRLLIFAAAISMFGNLSGEVLSIPRVLFSAARDGVLPVKSLARVHRRYATPYISVVVYATIGLGLACIGGFEKLAIISGASVLLVYLGVAISVIKLKLQSRRTRRINPDEFNIPGGMFVPLISVAIILWFLSSLTYNEKLGMVILALFSTGIYAMINWRTSRSKSRGK